MQKITLQQAADYLEEAAYLEEPIGAGPRVINFGINSDGEEFILINDAMGDSALAML